MISKPRMISKKEELEGKWRAKEDWERELEAELKDYEVVPGAGQARSGASATTKDDWDEGQIDELLKDEEDLK